MIADRRDQSTSLVPNGQQVYILTLTEYNHGKVWHEDPKVIGAHASKEAAVAAASTVDTSYGTFDEAIKTIFGEDFDYKDKIIEEILQTTEYSFKSAAMAVEKGTSPVF